MKQTNDRPLGSPQARELVESILDQRVSFTLQQVSWIAGLMAVSISLLGAFTMAVGWYHGSGAPFVGLGLGGVWCLLVARTIQRGRQARQRYRRWLWPIYALPTMMLLVLQFWTPEGASAYIYGPVPLGYFCCIVLSASLFRREVTQVVTVLSALGYMLFLGLVTRPHLQPLLEPLRPQAPVLVQDLLDWPVIVMRALVMLSGGWMLSYVVEVAHEVMLEVAEVIAQFGTIVDPRVRDLLLRGEVKAEGEVREVSVMFADIRGFTTFAEQWEPARLLTLMKDYFDRVGPHVRREDGTVLEYIGDEIMAVFGAPTPADDHAARCGRAALAMQAALRDQQRAWQEQGYPPIAIGIGLHTGKAVVGLIGSSTQGKYGILGDNVNLCSRLQSLTREYAVGALVSEAWVEQAGAGFVTREVDRVVVKGRSSEVTVYELVDRIDSPTATRWEALHKAWLQALTAWRDGHREACARALEACLELRPDDGPALRLKGMLERSVELPQQGS